MACQTLRTRLRCRGIDLICPHRRNRIKSPAQDGRKLRRYRRRWKVEWSIIWLQNFRPLVTRYEYHAHISRIRTARLPSRRYKQDLKHALVRFRIMEIWQSLQELFLSLLPVAKQLEQLGSLKELLQKRFGNLFKFCLLCFSFRRS